MIGGERGKRFPSNAGRHSQPARNRWDLRRGHRAPHCAFPSPSEPRFANAASFPDFEFSEPSLPEFLSDNDPGLPTAARSPSIAPRAEMPSFGKRERAAIAVSAVCHAALLVFFLNFAQDAARIAGGEQAGVLMLGNADQDQLRSGDASEPNVTHVSLIPVSKARPVMTAAVASTRAVEALAPTDAAKAVQPDDAIVPSDEASAEPETAAAPEAVAASPRSAVTEEAKPAEPAEADPLKSVAAVQPVEETVKPSETPSLPQRVAERPSPAKLEKPVEERHRETSSKAAKHLDQKRSTPARGSHGKDNADQRKGRAEGAENGRRAMASSGAAASSEGNAAVSNYPGKIVRKLRRALRYPRGAGSRRLHGVAEVRFVVSAGGGVGGIHLVASSGSPVLDKAALEAVRRAAPFPPIPAEAGRSNWPFTVPLAFVR